MGSPPPIGAKTEASVEKRYYLGDASGTVTAHKQQVYEQYLDEIDQIRRSYLLKGIDIKFDTKTGKDWSMPIREKKKKKKKPTTKKKASNAKARKKK